MARPTPDHYPLTPTRPDLVGNPAAHPTNSPTPIPDPDNNLTVGRDGSRIKPSTINEVVMNIFGLGKVHDTMIMIAIASLSLLIVIGNMGV